MTHGHVGSLATTDRVHELEAALEKESERVQSEAARFRAVEGRLASVGQLEAEKRELELRLQQTQMELDGASILLVHPIVYLLTRLELRVFSKSELVSFFRRCTTENFHIGKGKRSLAFRN